MNARAGGTLVIELTVLSGKLSFELVIRVVHAPVKFAVAHLTILALLQVNDPKVLLKLVTLVAEVHPLKSVVRGALELETLTLSVTSHLRIQN